MPRNIITLDSDPSLIASFMMDQRGSVEKQFQRIKYVDLNYPRLIYVDTSANEWADTVYRKRIDIVGEADWVDADADDYPAVGTSVDMGQISIAELGVSLNWGRTEIIRAAQSGFPLKIETGIAAAGSAERMINRVAFFGSKKKQIKGFYNSDRADANDVNGVEVKTADMSIGDILKSTTQDTGYQPLIDFFQGYLNYQNIDVTKGLYPIQAIALPQRDYNLLQASTKPAYGGKSGLEVIEQNLKIKLVGELILQKDMLIHADIEPLKLDRMMLLRKDKTCCKFHLPRGLKFFPPYTSNGGKRWDMDGLVRTGATEFLIPAAFLYVDLPASVAK